VLDDLGKACELNDTMRKMANQDPDFEGLRKDEDFLRLVAGPKPAKSGEGRK